MVSIPRYVLITTGKIVTVDKAGRHHGNQVIQANITGNGTYRYYVPPDIFSTDGLSIQRPMLLTIDVASAVVCFNLSRGRVLHGGEDEVSFYSQVWFQAGALSLKDSYFI